jgi:hypothetical protein
VARFVALATASCVYLHLPNSFYDQLTISIMAKGWFNLESARSNLPDTHFFEGDSAFKFLGLTREQRLYGFIGWSVNRVRFECITDRYL